MGERKFSADIIAIVRGDTICGMGYETPLTDPLPSYYGKVMSGIAPEIGCSTKHIRGNILAEPEA